MKSTTLSLLSVGLLAASSLASNLFAQANTVPAGYFTVSIKAGTGTSQVLSAISLPLQDTATATGQMVGVVTGVTSNTISNSNAGWTANQLSAVATPYLVQITSGAAVGRTFLLSTTVNNTSTTATLDPSETTDLTTLGIVAGTDTYQIIPADTISNVFGTPATTGVVGATSAAAADQVQILGTTGWTNYYFNTTSNAWLRVGPPIPSNNLAIRPDSGVLYLRIGNTALNLVLMGRVPTTNRQTTFSKSGITFVANYWPTDTQLINSNIQNTAGWVSAASSTGADLVQILNPSLGWIQYYYNGSHWIRVGPPITSDTTVIPAGSAAIIIKQGSATGQVALSQTIPYSL